MDNLNNDALKDLQANSDNLSNSVAGLNDLLDALNKKQLTLATSFQQNSKAFKDNADNIQATGNAINDINDQLDKNAKMLNTGTASLQQNKVSLAGLLVQYDTLTKAQGDNAKGTKDLNTQIGQLSATVADQEKKLSKSREVFDFHKASTDQLKTSFESLKGSAGGFSDVLENSVKGFSSLKSGLSIAKTGLQGVGSAVKATGFGLLVTVLESVTEYFTKTKEGSQKLQQILAAVGVVIDGLQITTAGLGKIFIDAFTHPIESLKQLGKLILDNIINRFKAVLVIWDGVKKFDFKEISNGVLQAATGVTNLADKAVAAYNKVAESTKPTKEGVKQIHKAIAAGTGVVKKVSDDSAQAIADIAKAALEADQDVMDSKARLARQAMGELEKELTDTDKFYNDKLKAYKDFTDKYQAADTTDDFRWANLNKFKSYKTAEEQLNTEYDTTRLQILDKFNDQYADKIKTAESQLKDLNDVSEKTETQRKVESLQRQQGLVDKQIDRENEDRSAAVADQRAITDLKNQKEIDALNLFIAQEEKLNGLNNDKKIITAQNTAKAIAKIEKDAAAQKAHQEKLDGDRLAVIENKNNPAAELQAQKDLITDRYAYEIDQAKGNAVKIKLLTTQREQEISAISQQAAQQRKAFIMQVAQQASGAAFSIIKNSISSSSEAKIKSLEQDKAAELSNTSLTATQKKAIEDKYKAKEAAEKAKAFKEQQLVAISQAIINGALAITKVTAQSGVLAPLVIPGIIAETAIQVATIAAQKTPKFAKGGQYVSDGRGAVLPGYSRTDNTNAYLRSGEAVVVSEAMRNPWARNLVSAINVAHGGRDFATPNTGKGYAVGGIFTDGGNANRYYSQPMNNQKDLANTIAYQLINNFPPIYVDVKDVNNQQNILAQTVNRVNL